MMVSASLTLERFRCRCGPDAACDCPPVEVEFLVVGVVDSIGDEWAPEVFGAAEVDADRCEVLTGKELGWAEEALIQAAEARERLDEEARRPYVIEGGRC
jgi:hypothetical protein